jgi:protein phosphatase
MAVEILGERLQRLPSGARDRERSPDELARVKAALPALLQEWLRAANNAIYERGAAEPGVQAGRNMGTTLALLCIVDDLAVVAHVGDSRIYRIRGERIQALTRDHSVTAPEVGATAKSGRKRKYVTRALGTKPEVVPDLMTVDVLAGDIFVVCSDGLTDLVRDEEIAEIVRDRAGEVEKVPAALVNLANERGGRDNITVVVASVEVELFDSSEAIPFVAPPPLEPPPPWESSDLEEPV